MQTKMTNNKTSVLVATAMMMCLIMVAIFILRIPVPFTQGYVNLSDGIIFMGVMILDKKNGAVAAASGSALGDIVGGFAMWAPWSFFIKGGMAIIVGVIIGAFARDTMKEKTRYAVEIVAMICGGLFMVFGYFIAERVMYGSWAIAALGVPWNIGQFICGIVLAFAVMGALHKTSFFNKEGKL